MNYVLPIPLIYLLYTLPLYAMEQNLYLLAISLTGDKKMVDAEQKTEVVKTNEQIRAVLLKGFSEILTGLYPDDMKEQKEAFDKAVEAVQKAQKSDLPYSKVTALIDDMHKKQDAYEATQLTGQRAADFSVKCGNFLLSLQKVMVDFNNAKGVSYKIETGKKRRSGKEPGLDNLTYAQSLDPASTLTLKDVNMSHPHIVGKLSNGQFVDFDCYKARDLVKADFEALLKIPAKPAPVITA